MSMAYYPEYMWGFAVQGKDYEGFIQNLNKDYNKNEELEDFDVLDEALSGIMAYALLYPDEDIISPELDCDSKVLILGLDNQPELTSGPAYANSDAAIAEIKARVGKYLPDSFDYENNLGCYTYAIYG